MVTKNTKNDNDVDAAIESAAEENFPRTRPARSKVYIRQRISEVPSEIVEFFKKRGYGVRYIKWSDNGVADYRYLGKREREGYEFVTAKEMPPDLIRTLQTVNINTVNGLLTNGADLCLMKIDLDLRDSRNAYFSGLAEQEVSAADALVKKGGVNFTGRRVGAVEGNSRGITFRE